MHTNGNEGKCGRATAMVPKECLGVDVDKAVKRLPAHLGTLFLTTGEQRVRELDRAIAIGDAIAVMDAAHSLASLMGLLPIDALATYAREIYDAGERNELAAAKHPHQRLVAIMSWVLCRLRSHGFTSNAV